MFRVTELEFEQHLRARAPQGVTVKSLALDTGRTDTFYRNDDMVGMRFRLDRALAWVYAIPNKYRNAANDE